MNVHAVILAGGSGTRFWPASRKSRPKQLLPIAPGREDSLLAATLARIAPLCPPERVKIATGRALLEATRAALPTLPESAFLGEPRARNTAPCIGWATALIAAEDPDAIIMVLPSDQHVTDDAAFVGVLERAVASAASGAITVVGVEPTRPETGYGYVELGETLSVGTHRVARFVEKPTRELADHYVSSGQFLWNAGMFFFPARAMLAAIERHLPKLAAALTQLTEARLKGADAEAQAVEQLFEQAEATSIDFGVMERESGLAVVRGSFGWSDLGSWATSWELGEQDGSENVAPTGSVLVDARRNLIADLRGAGAGDRTIALVGVDNLCVVCTDDAILIIPRERAQDVREVVTALDSQGRRSLL